MLGRLPVLALLAVAAPLCAQAPATRPAGAAPAIPDNSAYILTPPAPAVPRINGPRLFGVRPSRPMLYSLPATGERPLTFAAENVPPGVKFDAATGRFSGSLAAKGEYKMKATAKNAKGSASRESTLAGGDTIALTPPMGWNSYNMFGAGIDEEKISRVANVMVSSALINHGWTYINMDDGWEGERHGPLNTLQPHKDRFVDIKAMVDRIHGMGLKVGIYHSPWVMTYGGELGGTGKSSRATTPTPTCWWSASSAGGASPATRA